MRGTCAVARVVMNHWDTLWTGLLKSERMSHEEADRYMDDLRVFMLALKMGWRWKEDGFYFCKEWEEEDLLSGKSPTLRTAENMILAMSSLLKFLKFTMEIPEQFEDGKLPTLDTKIWIQNRRVWYMFFEKPMSANVVIQAESALSEQVKLASLTQEVVRRLKHTSLELPHSSRLEVLELFSQKLTNSGHGQPFMERILLTGIAKYKRMVEANNQPAGSKGYKPLHQPSGSCVSRFRKKMMAKQN